MRLFNIPPKHKPKSNNTCLTCEYRERWQCNSKVFQYCSIRKSKRTQNGLLKIKCKTEACRAYKRDDKY